MITNQRKIEFCLYKIISNYPSDVQVEILSKIFSIETKSDERGNEGLYNTFMETPITDTRNNFVLES
jgi:DNA-directed RNA polymerase subunit beta